MEKRFYKPKKDLKGCATSINTSIKKVNNYDRAFCFIQSAYQVANDEDGNARFDWKGDNKITMKLGCFDAAKIIAFLERRTDKVELFHKTETANTQLTMKPYNDMYSYRLSKKDDSGKLLVCQHLITQDEAVVLIEFLKKVILHLK